MRIAEWNVEANLERGSLAACLGHGCYLRVIRRLGAWTVEKKTRRGRVLVVDRESLVIRGGMWTTKIPRCICSWLSGEIRATMMED